ncbi:hypothetical protein [Siminovitchia sp. 179-K 8D1 HS]|uniref:hypothetical protein n=1 Tax=Siminovitchia sp. 179-K 8D1 HS TaxID=3142385 RepID=UPI0039A10E5C
MAICSACQSNRGKPEWSDSEIRICRESRLTGSLHPNPLGIVKTLKMTLLEEKETDGEGGQGWFADAGKYGIGMSVIMIATVTAIYLFAVAGSGTTSKRH